MDVYETEEHQIETLKKWWKENGVSAIVGLVVGIGGIVGWRSWEGYQESRAINASFAYQQVVDIMAGGDQAQAQRIGEQLIAERPDSAYSAMTALLFAKVSMAEGDLGEARQFLQWVVAHTNVEEVKQIARLRMTRLFLQENRLDEAMGLILNSDSGDFGAAFEEIRGDILIKQGDIAGARSAYTQAIDSLVTTGNRDLLQMKIDDLGSGGSSGTESNAGTGS